MRKSVEQGNGLLIVLEINLSLHDEWSWFSSDPANRLIGKRQDLASFSLKGSLYYCHIIALELRPSQPPEDLPAVEVDKPFQLVSN